MSKVWVFPLFREFEIFHESASEQQRERVHFSGAFFPGSVEEREKLGKSNSSRFPETAKSQVGDSEKS